MTDGEKNSEQRLIHSEFFKAVMIGQAHCGGCLLFNFQVCAKATSRGWLGFSSRSLICTVASWHGWWSQETRWTGTWPPVVSWLEGLEKSVTHGGAPNAAVSLMSETPLRALGTDEVQCCKMRGAGRKEACPRVLCKTGVTGLPG